MEIKETTDYSIFKFREDNRTHISRNHVNTLASSIKSKNLLKYRPICLNSKMEIIDGQHRLEAAKMLGIPIFYHIQNDLKSEDVMRLNTSKAWSKNDILNFYCKNGNKEYIDLKTMMEQKEISVSTALILLYGQGKIVHKEFREGRFIFNFNPDNTSMKCVIESINIIKKVNGNSACNSYTRASKFWRALIFLSSHEDFNIEKWYKNLNQLAIRVCPLASRQDYLKLFLGIYNYKNQSPINLDITTVEI